MELSDQEQFRRESLNELLSRSNVSHQRFRRRDKGELQG